MIEIILYAVILLGIIYSIIQTAIDKSLNTKLLKENHKVLIEIRELLKNKIKISKDSDTI